MSTKKEEEEESMMSNWYRKPLVAVTATLGIVVCDLLGTGTGTAAAGTNGQQINYYSHYSGYQCTTGVNQIGDNVRNCTDLKKGANPDQGYWWVGRVSIDWLRDSGVIVTSICDVPKNQNEDFFTCYEPS